MNLIHNLYDFSSLTFLRLALWLGIRSILVNAPYPGIECISAVARFFNHQLVDSAFQVFYILIDFLCSFLLITDIFNYNWICVFPFGVLIST